MEIRGSWNLADAYWFVDQLGYEAVSDEGNGFVSLDSGSEPWWYPSLTNHRCQARGSDADVVFAFGIFAELLMDSWERLASWQAGTCQCGASGIELSRLPFCVTLCCKTSLGCLVCFGSWM